MGLVSIRCGCGRAFIAAISTAAEWPSPRDQVEAAALAALRSGWLHYPSTESWACPTCVDRSDVSGAAYQGAISRMLARVRKAVAL